MIITTTNTIEGQPIREYRGIVARQTIIGANVIKDFMANLSDFFGGRSGTYERTFAQAKDIVLNELAQEAQNRGANAVVGVTIDYETVGASNSMLMVCASGTAVVV